MTDRENSAASAPAEGDAALALALAQAVRDVGRALATDPRRVQGMVTDVLGHESRTRRAEIDAVVMAAEESIPEDLLAARIDLDTAVVRLAHRGLDTPVANFAVEVWRYALGMLAENAEPPSLGTGLSSRTAPGITDQHSDPDVADTVLRSPPPPPPHPVGFPAPAPVVDEQPRPIDPTAPTRARPVARALLIAVPVLVLAVAVGAYLWLARDDGSSLDAATSPGTGEATGGVTREEEAVTPTITEPAPTTAAAATSATIGFTPFTTPHGTVTRTWEITDGNLQATLVVVNDTGDPVTDERYYEAIPKSIADNASEISSSPSHTVIKDDPVIAWDLTIDSGATVTIRYTIPVTDDVTTDTLSTWRADQITAANEFSAERKARPRLEVVTRNGSVIATRDTAIELDVSPDATVVINGFEITPNSKGNWPVTGLAEGTNTLNIIAISPYGVRSRATLELIVQLPTTTTATTTTITPNVTTTTVKRPSPGGGGTTTTTPTTTATTTLPPSTTAAPVANITGNTSVVAGCSYTYSVSTNFSPTTINWTNGGSGSSETYFFDAPGSYTIGVIVGAPDGRQASDSISVTAVEGTTC